MLAPVAQAVTPHLKDEEEEEKEEEEEEEQHQILSLVFDTMAAYVPWTCRALQHMTETKDILL